MGHFCQFIEGYYKSVQIDLLVHNYNEVDIYAPDYVTVDDINNKFGLKLRYTRIVKVDIEKDNGFWSRLRNRLKIERITRRYDIFINYMFLSRHIGKAKFNIYGCMFPPRRYASEGRKGFKQLGAKILDSFFYRSYDLFLSNSQFTNHWLSYWWKSSPKNLIRYPPVFMENEMTGRYQEEKKQNMIISVGRFFVASHSKKQLEMVKMFINNRDVFCDYTYHLVGSVSNDPIDQAYLQEIKNLAVSAGNIFIHDNCSYEELMELYAQAKIFWHATGYMVDENTEPEKMEHFGITTVEAMSFGAVPVVIGKGGQKETVIPGETGYLWNSEEECVENTLKLIKDDVLRKKLAAASVERAYQFSIDEFYRQNRSIFDEYGL